MLTLSVYRGIQITFTTRAFTSGFTIVTVNSTPRLHRLPTQQTAIEQHITGCIVQRTRNGNTAESNSIATTCHTAVIVRLSAGQVLAIATIDGFYLPMNMTEHFTFWGVYKIS